MTEYYLAGQYWMVVSYVRIFKSNTMLKFNFNALLENLNRDWHLLHIHYFQNRSSFFCCNINILEC